MSKSKKDKKKHAKKSKADKAKLRALTKKQAKKKARKARAKLKNATVERLPLASRPASSDDEPTQVDFSSVFVTHALRQRVYTQSKLTPRQKSTTSRVIIEVMGAVERARLTPNVPPMLDKANVVHGEKQERSVDLATLNRVANNQDAAAEAQKFSSIGRVGLQYLELFVAQAKQLVLADAQATKAG